MRVLRMIDKLGDLTFSVIDFVGDNRIKTELIARYMETEQKEKAFGALTISPENYEFKIAAILKTDGRSIYIFDVNARKKDASAFRGEVWVDGETGMPLREEGRLLKSPHILLRNVRMTRDYELRDGISIVKHFRSTTDVRLLGVGTAVLDISFSNFSRSAPEQRAPKDLQ
jgi:hypothetical protein